MKSWKKGAISGAFLGAFLTIYSGSLFVLFFLPDIIIGGAVIGYLVEYFQKRFAKCKK